MTNQTHKAKENSGPSRKALVKRKGSQRLSLILQGGWLGPGLSGCGTRESPRWGAMGAQGRTQTVCAGEVKAKDIWASH